MPTVPATTRNVVAGFRNAPTARTRSVRADSRSSEPLLTIGAEAPYDDRLRLLAAETMPVTGGLAGVDDRATRCNLHLGACGQGDAMDQVEVDGLRIAYERAGHGVPLVLVHGYVGDGRSCWHRQIDALSDDFTVVAWDAPGAGRSSDPPERFGMAGYADCLAAFIERVGLGQPHVAGLSFGGALAVELFARHPAIPRSLVLASAYAGWAGSLPADVAEGRLQQALRLSELTPEDFVEELLPTMFSAATAREDVDAFGAAMHEFHPRGFRAMARAAAENLRSARFLASRSRRC